MTQDKERQDLYKTTREDLLKRQLSNSEIFDRAILTLSSAGLGLSIAFINNVVQIDKAMCICLLIGSWVFFVISIIVTLASFHFSQAGIKTQLMNAEAYYLQGDKEAQKRRNVNAERTEHAGRISAITFALAIFALTLFVSINIIAKGKPMTDQQEFQPSNPETDERGAIIPQMQQDPIHAGAPIPGLQPLSPTDSIDGDGDSDTDGGQDDGTQPTDSGGDGDQ